MGRHRQLAVVVLAGLAWVAALVPTPASAAEPAAGEPTAPSDASPQEGRESSAAQPEASVSAADFHAGQVWRFKTRPVEKGATLTVLLVETLPKVGVTVHFRLDFLHLRDPGSPSGFADSIDHLPISGAALARSVTTLVRDSAPLPDFRDDLETWRRLAAAGKVGVYNMTVAQVIGTIERKVVTR